MSRKKRVSKASWTNFWKELEIFVPKPNRTLKKYDPSQDERKLSRLGVSTTDIEYVKKTFESYQEPLLQFHRFARFFRKDTDTVVAWTKSRNASEAFVKLFKKLHLNNLKTAKIYFRQLFFLYKFNERGEGKAFEVQYVGRGSLEKIGSRMFSGHLSKHHENATFTGIPKFKIDSHILLPIIKDSDGKKVYKFIRLKKDGSKVFINIAADSSKEINLIKQKLSHWFNTFVDVPEVAGNLQKLLAFIKTGESDHFQLVGTNYFDDEYKLSVFPQYNQQKNIVSFRPFKQKFASSTTDVLERFINIRISDKEIRTRGQVFVNFYTTFTGGIIGAITLSLDDRRLNAAERKKIREDFEVDFGIPLGKLIRFDNISEDEIYRIFLQNTPRKQRKIELRSEQAFKIYNELVNNKLVTLAFESKDEACFCFNKDCRLKYQRKWNIKTCKNCGGLMFNDKKIVVPAIDEKSIADFLYKKFGSLGFTVERFKRKLIRRNIFTVEVRNGEKSVCFIPITRSLNDYHTEIMQFRYPNAILITSKDDAHELANSSQFEVLELYKLIPKLLKDDKPFVNQLIQKTTRNRLHRVRNLATQSIARITDLNFYKEKNKIAKNFGAEMFEADSSILLSYVFGNSIWLGANKRGSAFPDGITAFPLVTTKSGCFVWDTKFCETTKVVLGKDSKNERYIKDGKKNATIKDNGGLKGFIFISTVAAPKNFVTKYRKLAIKNGRTKILFLRAEHIASIFNHYKDNENDIQRSTRVKNVFFDSMKKLLFSTAKKKNAVELYQSDLDKIFLKNIERYKKSSTKKVGV